LRAAFEYFRAPFEDEKKRNMLNKKLETPILTIGGEASICNFTTTPFQMIANNVTGSNVTKYTTETGPMLTNLFLVIYFDESIVTQ
jgi:hypothetical protein